jgi:hypothetical protein
MMNRPEVHTTWTARSVAMLRQGLFIPSPSTPVTAFKGGLAIAALGLGTLLSVVRTMGPGALDTTLMEDASVFLSDALHKGLIETVTTSYAGFYHLVPRLLGQVAALFPADWAAAVLAVEAAVVTSLLSLMVYVASGGILQNRLQRLLVSAPSYILRPVPQVLVGARWVTEGPGHSVSGLLPVAMGWLIVAAVSTLAFLRVTHPQWLLAGVAVGFSVALYLFCVMTVGFASPRYGVPTAMLVMTAIVVLLTPRSERLPGRRQWLAAVGRCCRLPASPCWSPSSAW